MPRFDIFIYDEFFMRDDSDWRLLALSIEEQVQADGYKICYHEPNGFSTSVEFDNEADAIMFRLKYMPYHLDPPAWLFYKPNDSTE